MNFQKPPTADDYCGMQKELSEKQKPAEDAAAEK